MALKTDYKDYIPPSGGRRYSITANSDGSSFIEDVTQYQQVGDTWGAEDINQVNKLVNGAVYPNLLDNTDFSHPVNQRGVSGTVSAVGYFIDRWKLVAGTVQITDDGLELNGTISQILENAAGSNVTASASAGTASYDDSSKTFTLIATGQTIAWAKLEKGDIATPYVPKGYGVELAECQRYYVQYSGKRSSANIAVGVGSITGNNVFIPMILPAPMRFTPTVGGEYSLSDTSSALPITEMTINTLCTNVLYLKATISSTVEFGQSYLLYVPIGGYFEVSADL